MDVEISLQLLVAALLIFVLSIIYLRRALTTSKSTYRPIPVQRPNIRPTTIVDLRVYPVKSCRGFSVKSTNLLQSGLELDRQWMFVSWDMKQSKYKFITIRGDSKMTLINTSLDDKTDELVLTVDDPAIRIAVPAYPTEEWLRRNTERVEAEIWGRSTETRMFSEKLTEEISLFLGKDVRLAYKGTHTAPRFLRGNGAPQFLGRQQSLGFADMMPILVTTLASWSELHSRLKVTGNIGDDWTIERFRPNIILQGNIPWEEDTWKMLRIYSKAHTETDAKSREVDPAATGRSFILDVPSRCLRCQVPNVDPNTAQKNKEQPWNTLIKYRNIDGGNKHKPAFGMLCCPRNEGRVEVGMQLEVLDTVNDHFFLSPMKA
ncbi:hypothetical protein EJ05DRAFT_401811 [Pseudovirgaria hyperparasitica]|uniref:MOSC domain-containing protein n=1 Tax=Pseudovirgaria hyperparasitica TaxID=470096 RepID=A0A6A6W705_9PEZI|nr:uncharacterized protein EJ05DRAFT_401811 [Pseudovirgaria hyperparasitica]KAF2757804.1 hypothetical protein EJ05DRAFT_401811 [Pseudovirgaria hyperparasitica]